MKDFTLFWLLPSCFSPFKVDSRSRWFLSWVGLRGAVPIVFATYPLLAGAEQANMIFDIVFFVSLTSVLIQGTTLCPKLHAGKNLPFLKNKKSENKESFSDVFECLKMNQN